LHNDAVGILEEAGKYFLARRLAVGDRADVKIRVALRTLDTLGKTR
jgi:hypothetical protein